MEQDIELQMGLMPIRCTGCNKVMRQLAIESLLNQGKTINEVMNELTYVRICCRQTIMGSVPIVKLQKEIDRGNMIEREFERLNIENTGEEFTGFGVKIVDELPPDYESTEICFDYEENNEEFIENIVSCKYEEE